MAIIQLFTAKTTNGQSSEIRLKPGLWTVRFFHDGTYDSGTVKLQQNPENASGTWHDVTGSDATAKEYVDIVVSGKRVRADVSGAGGSLNLDAFLDVPDEALDTVRTNN